MATDSPRPSNIFFWKQNTKLKLIHRQEANVKLMNEHSSSFRFYMQKKMSSLAETDSTVGVLKS